MPSFKMAEILVDYLLKENKELTPPRSSPIVASSPPAPPAKVRTRTSSTGTAETTAPIYVSRGENKENKRKVPRNVVAGKSL